MCQKTKPLDLMPKVRWTLVNNNKIVNKIFSDLRKDTKSAPNEKCSF